LVVPILSGSQAQGRGPACHAWALLWQAGLNAPDQEFCEFQRLKFYRFYIGIERQAVGYGIFILLRTHGRSVEFV
jgi:hypothetical protein